MTAHVDATAAKPAGIEGLKAANTLTAQVITVAAGLLAFTVTFAEKFTPEGTQVTLPTALKISWLCFAAAIVFGFWTLMAVAGTLLQIDRGEAETNPKRTNIQIPARTMFVLFFAGVIILDDRWLEPWLDTDEDDDGESYFQGFKKHLTEIDDVANTVLKGHLLRGAVHSIQRRHTGRSKGIPTVVHQPASPSLSD